MAKMLTLVKIDSIDVTSKLISYEEKYVYGKVMTSVELVFAKTVYGLVAFNEGDTLEIWRGWTTATDEKIFNGYVMKRTREGLKVEVFGVDKFLDAKKSETNRIFLDTDSEAGKISEIFITLATNAGLTADGTTVQDSGTIDVLKKFVCSDAENLERMRALLDVKDWQMYYRADTDKVYGEPRGFTVNSTVIEYGVNIVKVPKWTDDIAPMLKWGNRIKIRGSFQEVETTETFNGDTSTVTFTLANEPISVKVYVDSVLKTGGMPGSTSSYDYEVDAKKKEIIFQSAPGSGTDNVDIRYSYGIPTPVIGRNQASIDSHFEVKKTFVKPEVMNTADAEVLLRKFLEYGVPYKEVRVPVRMLTTGIRPGQQFRVNDTVNGRDETLVLTDYVIRYPNDYDVMILSDKPIRDDDPEKDLGIRLRRLEEDALKDTDYIIEVVAVGVDYTFARDTITVKSRTLGDMYLLGNGDNARLGVVSSGTQPVFGGTQGSWTTEYTKTY